MRSLKILFLLLSLAPLASAPARAGNLDGLAEEGSVLFDGGGRYERAASENPAPEDRAALLAELKKHINIDDHGVPAEKAAMDSLLARLMDSKTARELSVQFIKEDAKVDLSFEEIPNTKIFTVDGVKVFRTSGGHTHTGTVPPQVHLNKAYLEARKEDAPDTLAHEMFGHALERKKAERFGVQDVYSYDQDEEANAGLIGWTVGAELGNKVEDGWAWIYMDNPANYHKRLKTNLPYYAGTLSTEEMKDPLSAYNKRLTEVNKLLPRIPIRRERYTILLKVTDHLPEPPHKMEASSFLTVREDISASIDTLPGNEQNLNEIKSYLEKLIFAYAGEKGRAKQEALAAKSKNDYFTEKQKAMEERRQVLSGLMLAKPNRTPDPPKRPGQCTWEQLEGIWDTHRRSTECLWQP